MLSLPPTVRVFVAVDPVDMRGSFDALAGAVRRLGLDPVDGHLYLFLNRRRRLAKVSTRVPAPTAVAAARAAFASWSQTPPIRRATV